jgi:hypothetical protein
MIVDQHPRGAMMGRPAEFEFITEEDLHPQQDSFNNSVDNIFS